MKALVVDFHLEPEAFYLDACTCVAIYKVIQEVPSRFNVFFDENMCIDPQSGFVDQFVKLVRDYQYTTATPLNVARLASAITHLLMHTNSQGYVHAGSRYTLLHDRPGMILITNDQYDLAMQYLSQSRRRVYGATR